MALGELLIDFTENGLSGQGNTLSAEANPGADMMLTEEELPLDAIADCRIFHFGTSATAGISCSSISAHFWNIKQKQSRKTVQSVESGFSLQFTLDFSFSQSYHKHKLRLECYRFAGLDQLCLGFPAHNLRGF